jgi:hypothetical protein
MDTSNAAAPSAIVTGPTNAEHRAAPWHRHTEPAHCEQNRDEHGRSAIQGIAWFGYIGAPTPALVRPCFGNVLSGARYATCAT